MGMICLSMVAEYLCIGKGGLYFQAVADDAGIIPECLQFVLIIGADLLQVEAIESLTKCIPLVKNTFPGQPCLKALQYQHLKELPVLMHRNTPFLVVI